MSTSFYWAIEQALLGKKVRRPDWFPSHVICLAELPGMTGKWLIRSWFTGNISLTDLGLTEEDLRANDWEIAE